MNPSKVAKPSFAANSRLVTDRRRFLRNASLLAAGGMVASPWRALAADAAATVPYAMAGRLYKTLKIGMIRVAGSLSDKFKAAKEAGFDGVELNAPGMDVAETKQAIADSGLPVDGTVCS